MTLVRLLLLFCALALGLTAAAGIARAAPLPAENADAAKPDKKAPAAEASERDKSSERDKQAIASGQQALSEGADFPWYDRQKDAARRVDISKEKPNTDTHTSSISFSWLTQLVWIVITLALGGLAFLLIRAFMQNRPAAVPSDVADVGTEVDRVEHLPMPIRRPTGDLLSEAQRHYREGNYREAIIYLYSHELVQLDKQQVIRLARGKTNRQYLRELSARRPLSELIAHTIDVFEDAFFGHRSITREQFESCWNRLPEFDSMIQGMSA